MPNEIDIRISTKLDPKGATAAVRSLQQVETAIASANKALSGGGSAAAASASGLAKVAAAARETSQASKQASQAQQTQAQSAAKLAQAEATAAQATARKAEATSRGAVASQRVAQAEQQTATAVAKTAAAQTQAAAASARLAAEQSRAAKIAAQAQAAQARLAAQQERSASAAERGEAQMLGIARAQARLASAAGDGARAESILAAAISKTDGSSRAALGAQTQLVAVQKRLADEAKGSGSALSKMFDTVAPAAGRAVAALGTVAIALAGLNSAAAAVKGVADFEQTLNMLRVTAQATPAQMQQISAAAKTLGADITLPATSAASATGAMLELVKAGLTVNQTLNAARGTLQLAAAAQMSEAEAAEYAAAALNGFGLSGERATVVADQFAAGAAASAVDVRDMAESLKMGGGLFASYQARVVGGEKALTTFNTAVGILGNVGIKGGQAGTYIASAMERMANPTQKAKDLMGELGQRIGVTGDIAYDANGKMRPFEEIMQNVAKATADMTQQQRDAAIGTLFLTEGSKAVVPILAAMNSQTEDGITKWEAMGQAVTRAGAAQDLAKAQMEGLNGAVAGLQSQVETLALNGIEPLLPLMTEVVSRAADLASSLSGQAGPAATALADGIRTLGSFIAEYAIPAVAGATVAYGTFAAVQGVVQLQAAITSGALATATREFVKNAAAATAAAAPYAVIGLAVATLVNEYQTLQRQADVIAEKIGAQREESTRAAEVMQRYANASRETREAAAGEVTQLEKLRAEQQQHIDNLAELQAKKDRYGQSNRNTAGLIQQQAEAMAAEQAEIERLGQAIDEQAGKVDTYVQAELEVAAASQNATSALQGQPDALAGVGQAAALTADELQALYDQLQDIYSAGGEAIGGYVQNELGFYAQLQQGAEEYNAKVAELIDARAAATTEKERAAVDEQLATVREGYAAQTQAQAEAYSQQQAAQNAHLGKMLQDYVVVQAQMGNIDKDQAARIVETIGERFGILEDQNAATFLRMAGQIDEFVATGNGDLASLGTNLLTERDKAVELQGKMDALQKQYVAEVLTELKGQPPEVIAAALRAIPARVYSEVVISERRVQGAVSSGTTRGVNTGGRNGGEVKAAGGAEFVTQGPTTLTVGDNPGGAELVTVTPLSGTGTTQMRGNVGKFAGGGSVVATGGPAASSRGRRSGNASEAVEAARKLQSQLEEIAIEGGRRLQEIDRDEAKKLVQLYGKFARDQIKAARDLQEELASERNASNYDDQLNDLQRFNKNLGNDERKALEEREKYEDAANQRMAAARAEASGNAARVDVAYAKEVYEARKRQSDRQRELDEQANEARRNVSKKNKADLEREIAETQAASDQQFADEVAMAEAAAAERAQAKQQEVDDVRGAAADQRADVIAESAKQADAVISNSQRSSKQVNDDLSSQREAWGKNTEAVKRYNDEVAKSRAPATPVDTTTSDTGSTGGGTQGVAAGGGGQGVAATGGGAKSLTAKSAGKGSTGGSASAAEVMATLGDALEIVIWLDAQAKRNEWNRANSLPQFVQRMKLALDSVNAIVSLRDLAKTPASPIDPAAIRAMVTDMVQAVTILGSEATPALNSLAQRISVMSNAAKLTAEVLGAMATFRKDLVGEDGKLAAPIPADYLRALIGETVTAVNLMSKAFSNDVYPASFRKGMEEFVSSAQSTIDLLAGAADLRRNLQEPAPPITPEILNSLAETTQRAVEVIAARLIPLTEQEHEKLQAYAETAGAAVSLFSSVAGLDADLAEVDGTIFYSTLNNLADAARDALTVIQARMLPLAEAEVAALRTYTETAGNAIDILSSAASLASDLSDLKGDGTVPLSLLQRLAETSRAALAVVTGLLIPTSEDQAAALERWASASGSAIDVLSAAASLYGDVEDLPTASLSFELLYQLAADARMAEVIVDALLLPTAEAQVEKLGRWRDAVGSGVDVLQSALSLRKAISEQALGAPPSEDALFALADDGRRALRILDTVILPISEETAQAYSRYNSVVGDSVGALSSALDLSGGMFADYISPSDAQLRLLADDGRRIVRAVADAAKVYGTEGLEATKAYGDALGSTVGAFEKTLQFNAALSTGDFQLDTDRLATFVAGTETTIAAAARLAARAAQVPAGDLAALNTTATTLANVADAQMKLNAAPLNVPNFAGFGGGGSNFNITFEQGAIQVNGTPGMDAHQLAQLVGPEVISHLQQQMRMNK